MGTERAGYATILIALRREMKHRGIRVAQLAADLGITEPTLWRWLRGKGLTLEALDRICRALDLDLRDLIALADDEHPDQFTLSQERILAADRGLALLFFALLNGARRDEIERDFALSPARIESYLERLARLGLIDRGPRGRIRALTSRAVRWRRGGPLAAAFEKTVKHFFLSMDFADAGARYVTDMIRISDAGRARIHALFEALRSDIHVIAQQEQAARLDAYEWSAVVMLVHALDVEGVSDGLGGGDLGAGDPARDAPAPGSGGAR